MPELPEVSYSKKYADATVLHKKIKELLFKEDLILKASQKKFKEALVHHKFERTLRHGKYLFLEINVGQCLVLHFGMTGHLEYMNQGEAPKYAYFTVIFSDGSALYFSCPRKLARVYLAESVDQFIKEHNIGPDALALSLKDFEEIIKDRRGSIKGLLMNQRAIAGIGNLYSDEILFQSGIHPKTTPSVLSEKEIETVYKQLGKVLKRVTTSRIQDTALPSGYLTNNRKKGGDCPGCKGKLNMLKVAGRSSYFCPECQPPTKTD